MSFEELLNGRTVVHSLTEALRLTNGVAIFEGDYGGQVYATCPVHLIKCDDSALQDLLIDIDNLYWNDAHGRQLLFSSYKSGSGVVGGMGGARVADGLWCHHRIRDTGLASAIEDVLLGVDERLRIPPAEASERLANEGDTNAMFFLGNVIYRRSEDSDTARKWYQKAAALGHLGAQEQLSRDRSLDSATRIHWLKVISARSENNLRIDNARMWLAHTLESNEENPELEAFVLLLNCNRRYNASGAMRLATLLSRGIGVPVDRTAALMWFTLGNSSSVRTAPYWTRLASSKTDWEKLRVEIENGMSDKEIEQALELANNYFQNRFEY